MADSEIRDNAQEMGNDRTEMVDDFSENNDKDKTLKITGETSKTESMSWKCGSNDSFDFGKMSLWIQRYAGPWFWDWPPAKKWGKGDTCNDELVKKGKSPMEIWEVHSANIVKRHEELKEYHENIIKDYEKSKKDNQTMEFWKQYWKTEFQTEFPNPEEMEDRWKNWGENGRSKEKFWKEERKRCKNDCGWSFWKKRKAECKVQREEEKHSRMCLKTLGVKRGIENTDVSERPIFKMFDF